MSILLPVELVRRAHCSDEEKMQLFSFVQAILAQATELKKYNEVISDHATDDLRFLHRVYLDRKEGNDIDMLYIQPLVRSSFFGPVLMKKLISIVAADGFVGRNNSTLILVRISALLSPPDSSKEWVQDWYDTFS